LLDGRGIPPGDGFDALVVEQAQRRLLARRSSRRRVLNGRLASWPAPSPGAAVRDCPALTERDLSAVTERDVRAGCGLLLVERVVDRVPCALGAFCASSAFRCAIGAGSAARAVRRGHGKEKVYGSIP